jgi:hypothetical protein
MTHMPGRHRRSLSNVPPTAPCQAPTATPSFQKGTVAEGTRPARKAVRLPALRWDPISEGTCAALRPALAGIRAITGRSRAGRI